MMMMMMSMMISMGMSHNVRLSNIMIPAGIDIFLQEY